MTVPAGRSAAQRLMKSNKWYPIRYVLLLAVVSIIILGGWVWWRDGMAAFDPGDTSQKKFIVRRGEGVKTIAGRLAGEGLIRSPTGFFLLVKLLGIERKLQAGEYRLYAAMDTTTIARELTHGMLDVWVTIPEGWRVEETVAKLSRELDIPESEFIKVAREGYLFPDTYLVPKDATAGAVVQLFSSNFDEKVNATLRSDAKKTGLSFHDVITLASIVEREGRNGEDRPVIAGILLNRLKADWPIQADATLQYALGYQMRERSWWKKELTAEDKELASPYNTYRYTGLPPGPIANPGIVSITSVTYPRQTEYWYYLHDPKGTVHYAKTLEEHNSNIAKYLP